jgi:hypothetical protein
MAMEQLSITKIDQRRLDQSRNVAWALTGRDPVVMQAIDNVAASWPVDEHWGYSSRERTQAIYDEIKRLDLARASASVAQLQRQGVRNEPSGHTRTLDEVAGSGPLATAD